MAEGGGGGDIPSNSASDGIHKDSISSSPEREGVFRKSLEIDVPPRSQTHCLSLSSSSSSSSDEETSTTESEVQFQQLSHWISCICVVTFDLELGQAIEVSIMCPVRQ